MNKTIASIITLLTIIGICSSVFAITIVCPPPEGVKIAKIGQQSIIYAWIGPEQEPRRVQYGTGGAGPAGKLQIVSDQGSACICVYGNALTPDSGSITYVKDIFAKEKDICGPKN